MLLTGIMITGCSNDDSDIMEVPTKFEELKFIVNVHDLSTMNKCATGKIGWNIDDRIVVAIDGDNSNRVDLKYQGEGKWEVTKLNENSNFNSDSGKLAAVHADRIKTFADSMITEGDILYTQDGTYTRHDNVVAINLNMSQRPVSRIAIVGMDSTCWIDEMQVYDRLSSLVNMRWIDNRTADEQTYKEIYGDTCVFYGNLVPDINNTITIKLVNKDGAVYSRTYSSKSVKRGDYVIIQGPESSESNKWTSHVPVVGITAVQENVNLLVDETGDVSTWYRLSPSKPTNANVQITSSNTDVLNVENGKFKAVGSGNSLVTVTTEDGGYSCQINVSVKSILDLVTFNITGVSIISSYMGVYYGKTFTITNNSDFDIYITELDGALSGGQKFVKAHSSIDITNYYQVDSVFKTIKLVFLCNGRTYEKSGTFEI